MNYQMTKQTNLSLSNRLVKIMVWQCSFRLYLITNKTL